MNEEKERLLQSIRIMGERFNWNNRRDAEGLVDFITFFLDTEEHDKDIIDAVKEMLRIVNNKKDQGEYERNRDAEVERRFLSQFLLKQR